MKQADLSNGSSAAVLIAMLMALTITGYATAYLFFSSVEDYDLDDGFLVDSAGQFLYSHASANLRVRKAPGGRWGMIIFKPAAAVESRLTDRQVMLSYDTSNYDP